MKSIILTIFTILFCLSVNAQNAFYDSKYIIDWYSTPREIANEDEQKKLDSVITKLNKYFGDTLFSSRAAEYSIIKSLLDKIKNENKIIPLEKLSKLNLKKNARIDTLITAAKTAVELLKNDTATSAIAKDINNFKSLVEDTSIVISELRQFSYLDILKNDSISIQDSVIRVGDIINFQTYAYGDSLRKFLRSYYSAIETEKRRLALAQYTASEHRINAAIKQLPIEDFGTLTKALYGEKRKKDDFIVPVFKQTIAEQEKTIADVAHMRPAQQFSNFAMPTQAQIIDAFAIYLAKRFKQEAILYMMDQIRDYSAVDTLFRELLPETSKLLYSSNEYQSPNFGADWRYALSKDYTLMPKHIIYSPYIQRQFPKVPFAYLKDGYAIADLVSKRYTYTDIIDKLYHDNMQSPLLNEYVTWAYITNEELFTLDSSDLNLDINGIKFQNYWVSAKKFEREFSDPNRMLLMLVMIEAKYGVDFKSRFNLDLKTDSNVNKIKKVQTWVTRNLTILNQFQKNQNTVFSNQSGSNNDFNAVTYWTFLNDITNTFLDTNFIHLPGNTYNYLSYSSDIYDIYSSLQSKNYTVAMYQTLSIIDRIGSEHRELISTRLNVDYDRFKTAMDRLRNTNFDEARRQLIDYSMYFTDSIVKDDIDYFNRTYQTTVSIIDREYKHILTNPEDINGATTFIDLARSFKWGNLKSYKALDSLSRDLVKKVEAASGLYVGMDTNMHRYHNMLTRILAAHKTDSLLYALNSVINNINTYYPQNLRDNSMRDRYIQLAKELGSNINDANRYKTFVSAHDSIGRLINNTLAPYLNAKNRIEIWAAKFNPKNVIGFWTDRFANRISAYSGSYYASLDRVRKYTKLFNDVLAAGSNSEQLANVIESNAAPVGSYKIKRRSGFTIDLGAYLGVYAGAEWLPNHSNSTAAFVYGLSVPVGINFNWGVLKRYNPADPSTPYVKQSCGNYGKLRTLTGHSFTASLSIIDIAAPVTYRLTTAYDETNGLPSSVNWSQLFAPGVHFRWGIKNTPFTVSIGMQLTPELRSIKKEQKQEENGNVITTQVTDTKGALRAYAGFMFDLPLIYIKD